MLIVMHGCGQLGVVNLGGSDKLNAFCVYVLALFAGFTSATTSVHTFGSQISVYSHLCGL